MASATLKLENGLCRCCHAEGTFKSLDSAVMSQEQEIFSNILRECFDVTIIPVDGDLSAVTYTICETCSNRLFEASTFKKQVLSCEERFRDLYSDHVFKTLESLEADVKVELPESFNQDLKEEFSRDDSALDEDDIFTYPDGDGDDDDDKKDLCFELNVDTSEKKRKAKSKRKIKSKEPKVKKSKRGRPKKKLESDTKHDGETTSEQSKSTKKGRSLGRRIKIDPEEYIKQTDPANGETEFICRRCEHGFKHYSTLNTHLQRVHQKRKSVKCLLCTETFIYYNSRKTHMRNVHGIYSIETNRDKGPQGIFTCNYCGKKYVRKNGLREHIAQAHLERKCSLCNLKFTKRNIMIHMGHTHGVKLPTCGICGLESPKRSKIVAHQRQVHMKEKTIPCDFCDMMFYDRACLKSHMVKHIKEKTFKCIICYKIFARKKALNLHLRIHTGDKRNVCGICEEAFVQKASLNYHMKKYHPENV